MSETLCRLCFIEKPKRISIFGGKGVRQKTAQVIRLHFPDEVKENDHLPQSICLVCWNKLESFHIFYDAVNEAKLDYLANFVKAEAIDFLEIICDAAESDQDDSSVKNEIADFIETKTRSPSPVINAQDLKNESNNYSDEDNISTHISETQAESDESDENIGEELPMEDSDAESIDENSTKAADRSITQTKSIENETKLKECLISNCIDMNCDSCGVSFSSLSDAISHYRSKHNKHSAMIPCCQRRLRLSDIPDHIRYHLNPDAFMCEHCGKRFTEKRLLRSHQRIHVPKTFECDICKKRFSFRSGILSHMQIFHGNGRKLYKCDECDKRFDTRNRLEVHANNVHKQQNQTVCHICARTYTSLSSFRTHLRVKHSEVDEPRANCKICGRSYKNEQYVRRHMKTAHQKVDHNLQCPTCGKTSANRNALYKHISAVHNYTVHKCNMCGKEFKQGVALKEHMATHTGENLYTCSYCPQTFRCKSNMYKHRKKSHPDQWVLDRKNGNFSI